MGETGEIILVVERAGKADHTFAAALRLKGYEIVVAPTGVAALAQTSQIHPAMIVLNSASLGSSGLRICRELQTLAAGTPVIHIVGADMLDNPNDGVAEMTLILPFTARKLINSVKRLMPSARNDMIAAGPIRLAPHARIVEAYGKEKRLTARTANLLELFIRHPDEVLDRSFLMRQLWHTDYMGDTRTLDVHIRWAREAVEADPRRPRHILTVRGQGYRFVPEPKS